jgi:hypothetical protein
MGHTIFSSFFSSSLSSILPLVSCSDLRQGSLSSEAQGESRTKKRITNLGFWWSNRHTWAQTGKELLLEKRYHLVCGEFPGSLEGKNQMGPWVGAVARCGWNQD